MSEIVGCPVERVWGAYTVLHCGARFKVKRLDVQPGKSLSLQSHLHRMEHWVVVDGTAEVLLHATTALLYPGNSVRIAVGARHRLRNPGKIQLTIIETQIGSYLGEDDITRYDEQPEPENKSSD